MEYLTVKTLREIHDLADQCRTSQTGGSASDMTNLGGTAVPQTQECSDLLKTLEKLSRDELDELTTLMFHGQTEQEATEEYAVIEERAKREKKDPIGILLSHLLLGHKLKEALDKYDKEQQ